MSTHQQLLDIFAALRAARPVPYGNYSITPSTEGKLALNVPGEKVGAEFSFVPILLDDGDLDKAPADFAKEASALIDVALEREKEPDDIG